MQDSNGIDWNLVLSVIAIITPLIVTIIAAAWVLGSQLSKQESTLTGLKETVDKIQASNDAQREWIRTIASELYANNHGLDKRVTWIEAKIGKEQDKEPGQSSTWPGHEMGQG